MESLPLITFIPKLHNRSERILLQYDNLLVVNRLVRTLPGVRWSQTFKAWHIPLNEASYQSAIKKLEGVCATDIAPLRIYLQRRKLIQGTMVAAKHTLPDAPIATGKIQGALYKKLSNVNLMALEQLVLKLKGKGYSESTITTYRSEMMQLLQLLGSRSVDSLLATDLQRYMVYAMEKEGISEHTAHSRINALKFYFEQVLGREKFFFEIPRPKKPLQLPKVLGERELEKMFAALTNKKHKAVLFTAYSGGMRVSEVCNLRLTDIDSGRMQIFIRKAKGKKDRYVTLSPVLLDILRNYIQWVQPRPLTYLFEGQAVGSPYPSRTAQQIFYNAKKAAGIEKEVSFHSLRHSFATHLLEKGVDIKFIKDILGHFDIKTTERYTHVAKEKLVTIISPLDDLWKRGNLEI